LLLSLMMMMMMTILDLIGSFPLKVITSVFIGDILKLYCFAIWFNYVVYMNSSCDLVISALCFIRQSISS
jgi:hypothetical protein